MAKSHKTCMEQAEIIDTFGTYQLPAPPHRIQGVEWEVQLSRSPKSREIFEPYVPPVPSAYCASFGFGAERFYLWQHPSTRRPRLVVECMECPPAKEIYAFRASERCE